MPTGQASRFMPTLRRVVLARQSAARSDGELLGAFAVERDADAFAELVRRHGAMVLGVCRRVTGDRATADDAFQASFLVLARRAASVRPREQVGNFLYGVAYRTALKARMVLARRRSREKQVDVMPEPTAPAPRPAWNDLQPIIDEELARLPDKLRLPVVLCDLEGRPQREVAKHLNVPPATLATRLASARRTLAARLTRRGVTLSGGALAGLLGAHASAGAVSPTLASGAVRAGEAVATGSALDSLVSANAVQLSEGVMRMMMLAKLKAVAVLAVTALALTTGLGLGLVPATADDASAPRSAAAADRYARAAPPPAPAPRPKGPAAAPKLDDATFLRRLCLDVRGTQPTDLELWYFVSDGDGDKRVKVVNWITSDERVRLFVAKRLGVLPYPLQEVRGRISADGKFVEIKLERTGDVLVHPIAVAPDDKLTVEGLIRVVDIGAGARLQGQKVLDRVITKDAATSAAELDVVAGRILLADDTPGKGGSEPPRTVTVGDAGTMAFWVGELVTPTDTDSDAEFLKRVLTDVRGSGPTALELKYFTEDKDPKKREKLLDALLKDSAVQKKLGDAWKAKMLAPRSVTFKVTTVAHDRIIRLSPEAKVQDVVIPKGVATPQPPQPPKPPQPPVVKPLPPAVPQADKFEKLVGELIAAKKSDEGILEALALATLGRLPTDGEKRLALAGVSGAADRKAAWVAVARALAGTDDK
ncbi:MAG: sigma-70 family RNA polymerase sigma factor, partial [Planctomycetes bacterium]|nr:sigma-70 family RNA polymerase sigma factor [Planctomycetota bacterium]